MKSNAYKPGLRVELEGRFRRELFDKLLTKHSYTEVVKLLEISHGMIYHYKNKRTKTIPLNFLEKIISLVGVSKSELLANIKQKISSEDLRHQRLEFGREFRHKQLKSWRKELPQVSEIFHDNIIDVEKWFNAYRKLFEMGKRKIEKCERNDNSLILSYSNFVKGKLKSFTKVLPRKINLDEDFQYFFGLWCGDRAGGGRIGLINKDEDLIRFTEKYLIQLYQKPKFVLMQSSNFKNNIKIPFNIDEVIKIKNMNGTYVILVFAINGALKSFFDYLQDNLDKVLNLLPNKNIFFAGLFDAEGNVFFEDGAFRWACKHPIRTKIYIGHLKSIKLFDRYDGNCLITKNTEAFKSLMLPYLRQQEKVSKARILCGLQGSLDARFKNMLLLIDQNPSLTNNELAKLLKLKKTYAQVNFLEKFGYVRRYGYPKKVAVMEKGLKELEVM